MAKKKPVHDRAAKAQAARDQQQRSERRRTLLSVGGVVLVMALIVGIALFVQQSRTTTVDAAAASSEGTYGVAVGPDDAPHEVIVYEDFLCPYCGELEKVTHEKLTAAAEAGKVQVEYRPFDLLSQISDYSARAANAFAVVLDASGPDVAKKFHDLLYENQPEESAATFPSNEDLLELAVKAGAKEADVSDGILNDTMNDWVVKATKAAEDAGVRGTPTVLLDGKVVQAGSIDEMAQKVLDAVE
ncbi:DsbA family protein [Nocardioides acrostichi]|uniref:Thioredoxin domain-containing protein n=1 Tax=Nocardioides acrostichi TaxID=2784339 RepID=A0A930YB37_9ACTN|nr:thioredoxin domain-containing protein [Nocardioides acrostichi]MBF4160119.1 thioredoxin domain-containing protein [Nocardioides acrostichi]